MKKFKQSSAQETIQVSNKSTYYTSNLATHFLVFAANTIKFPINNNRTLYLMNKINLNKKDNTNLQLQITQVRPMTNLQEWFTVSTSIKSIIPYNKS